MPYAELAAPFLISTDIFPRPLPPSHLPNGLSVTGLRVEYDVICATCQMQEHPDPTADAQARKNALNGKASRRRKASPNTK